MQTATRPDIDPSRGILETMRTVDGRVVALDRHLRRAGRSARLLYGAAALPPLEAVAEAARQVPEGPGRLRLALVPRGRGPSARLDADLTCVPFERGPAAGATALAPVDAHGGLGAHKWLDRSWLEAAAAAVPGALPLLVDGDDVLEASRSNLFAVTDGTVVTPPLDGRILAGVGRARMIELLGAAGVDVREVPLTRRALAGATEVFLVNALRGPEPVSTCSDIGAWPCGQITALAMELAAGSWAP